MEICLIKRLLYLGVYRERRLQSGTKTGRRWLDWSGPSKSKPNKFPIPFLEILRAEPKTSHFKQRRLLRLWTNTGNRSNSIELHQQQQQQYSPIRHVAYCSW
mmetsp:Transcript_52880/g.87882  ORF Transcript_52880/g.87882 Transcript_52880/m.87882 type:complete len:102 (+) Transcript_52880:410-715(+)